MTTLPRDASKVPYTRYSDVKPSGLHVGLINLSTSGCGETLHAIIAGTEQDGAENIDGKMQPRAHVSGFAATPLLYCPETIVDRIFG